MSRCSAAASGVIDDIDFQAVTEDAKHKDRFVVVDAVGITIPRSSKLRYAQSGCFGLRIWIPASMPAVKANPQVSPQASATSIRI